MNCSGPDEASCQEVLAELWLFLDNECDQQRRAAVQQHLDDCGSCLEHFGIEEHIKTLLYRKCSGEHAPTELKDRLRASIREAVLRKADVTVEYGPEGTSVEVRAKRTSTE